MTASSQSLPWHSLTPREQQTIDVAARGHGHKDIASELGVTPGMVARHLASAKRKVGMRSRVALVASYRRDEHGRPGESAPPPADREEAVAVLSPSEREILPCLFEGMSNAAIAGLRGRSVRTVANQVASIYRKLGVCSRLQLVAQLPPVLQGSWQATDAGTEGAPVLPEPVAPPPESTVRRALSVR
jgi:DNA-binding NarL/FixJ family response regulator